MGLNLSMIWLAIAVSLDSLSVGITYGMRKIRLPFLSTVIIAICSGCLIFISMALGSEIKHFLDPSAVQIFGVGIFLLLGCWAIFQSIDSFKPKNRRCTQGQHVWKLEVKSIGIVIQILRTPMVADVDRSGSISAFEAVLLGIALSLDAFGAGLGAAMLNLPANLLSISIAIASVCFLRFGMWLGFRFAKRTQWTRFLSCVPGVLLILMGLSRLFS